MSAGHTPGPWLVGISGNNAIHCVDARRPEDDELIEICEVWGTYKDTEETDVSHANARLIAAAPELLEALEECASDLEAEIEARRGAVLERTMERDLATVARARAIIAKATGQ